MTARKSSQVDLAKVFHSVARELKNNQQSLNAADEYNHNHGDNMVENFQVITRAMRQTRGSAPSDQLAYASQVLSQRSHSGSAQLYAQGLANAAEQMRGQPLITPENAMLLVQSLMGGQPAGMQGLPQAAAAQSSSSDQGGGMDLLGSLLGGMTGETQAQANPWQGQPAQQNQSGGDLLGSLLGSFLGQAQTGQAGQQATQAAQPGQGGGIDLNTLLTAGMAFFQARQQGAAPLNALVQAVMAGSQMQGTSHHAQSGQLVAQTLLNVLGTALAGRT